MEKLKKAKDWVQKKWYQGIALAQENKGKTVAVAVVTSLFITGSALANHYYNANSKTLYHVYVDGQEIGTVDNPDRVNQFIKDEIVKQSNNNIKPKLQNQIDFKEEVSLEDEPNTEETMKVLEKKIEIKVAAQAVIINGKTIGFVSDKQEIESILTEIKGKYGQVPLSTDKSKTVSTATIPVKGEVQLKEDVQTEDVLVTSDEIITKDELKTLIEKGTLEQMIHTVKQGDCLGCIAQQYGITTKEIYRNNPEINEHTLLQLGQTINVTAAKPLLTVITLEEKQEDVTLDYQIEVESTDTLFRGDSRVIQKGKEGFKKITYQIIKENGIETERKVLNEEVLSEPIKKIIQKGTKVKPDRGDGNFAWPTYGGRITSGFGPRWGRYHEGLDIAGVSNRTIIAADNGRVIYASWKGNYGNCVIIDHGNGYQTLYGHLKSINVSVGDVVQKGEKVGVMGSTGESTGVHLHFEILKNGVNKNPIHFFRS